MNARIVAALVLYACVCFAAAFVHDSKRTSTVWDRQVALWMKEIRDSGGQSAYADFSHEQDMRPMSEIHSNAHAFGKALFRAAGLEGLPVCDSRFSYGCLHQFLADAIAEYGVEDVGKIASACPRVEQLQLQNCEHGLGHGLVSTRGYDVDSLTASLNDCAATPDGNDTVAGCVGGVFMEYNMHTILDMKSPRRYEGDAFGPCTQIPERFKDACAVVQPQWWFYQIYSGRGDQATFKKMGGLCSEMSTTKSMLGRCLEGIGTVVVEASDYKIGLAGDLCDAAAPTEYLRVRCRSTAAGVFATLEKVEDPALLCGGFSGDTKKFCLAQSRNDEAAMRTIQLHE